MGNTSSATLRIREGKAAQVVFDLRQERVTIPYQLATAVKGRFELPLKLGEKTVLLSDAAALARSGALEVTTFPIDLEERDRLSSSKDIAAIEGDARLAKGAPVSVRDVVQEGEWVHAGRMDSDLGSLIVLSRVQKEIRTWIQIDLDRKNWIGRKRSWVIGRAQGTLQVAVRARFETEGDRTFFGKLLRRAVSSVRSILQLLTGRYRTGVPRKDLPSSGVGVGAAVPAMITSQVQSGASERQIAGMPPPTKQASIAKVQGGTKGAKKEEEPCKTM